jgi:hypothetical protein
MRRVRRCTPPDRPLTFTDRLGSAALGLLAGLPAGLLAWALWLRFNDSAPALARFVFGGAGVCGLLGFLSLDLGFGIVAGLLAVLAGFFAAGAADQGRFVGRGLAPGFQRETTPAWKRVALWACVAAGVAIFALLAWID